jgi:hypothetical protein
MHLLHTPPYALVPVLPSIITYARIDSYINFDPGKKAARLCSALCHKAAEVVVDEQSGDIS